MIGVTLIIAVLVVSTVVVVVIVVVVICMFNAHGKNDTTHVLYVDFPSVHVYAF